MLVELAVVDDVLANKSEPLLRNEKSCVLECSLLRDAGSDLLDERLRTLRIDERLTLLGVHVAEDLACALADDCLHSCMLLSCCSLLAFCGSCCSVAFFLGLLKFSLKLLDLLRLLLNLGVVLCLLSLKLIYGFLDCCVLLVGRSCCDVLLELRFALLQLVALSSCSFQRFLGFVNLLAKHECFQHDSFLLSAFSAYQTATSPACASSYPRSRAFGL